jgi:uncharacterized protein YjbJ (UPF0337 family)
MSKDISEKIWNQCRHKVQSHWNELSEDEIDHIQGDRDKFIEIVQKRYVLTEEEAGKQFDDFKEECEID